MVEKAVIVSLHDVMPETFQRVEEILSFCRERGIPPIALLVVPGRNWQPAQIGRLRELSNAGHPLAAHGWHHQVKECHGLYHRVHSALLSGDVAEHLALDSEGIRDLMCRSCEWFGQNDLTPPKLYVPPAWALGRLRQDHLAEVPVGHVEVLHGLIDTQTGRCLPMPMVGFEAASRWRAIAVRAWNTTQAANARLTGRPLRIAIHPNDFHLKLKQSLRNFLNQPSRFVKYPEKPINQGIRIHHSA